MTQIEYTKKPSITTLRAALVRAINAGSSWIQFTCGENQITIELGRWGWEGSGWIGRNSGYDLARELTNVGTRN
jgi:hypothetical protein